jgi:ParB-like chromosome segregation protein Spo0J
MKWKLVTRKLSELKPYEKNPRKMTEKGMKDLHKSIDSFGLAEPIVINTDNTIIGGHGRFYALKEKGVKECIRDKKESYAIVAQ